MRLDRYVSKNVVKIDSDIIRQTALPYHLISLKVLAVGATKKAPRRTPDFAVCQLGLCAQLDFHIDTGREVELHQRVHGLRSWINDVEHTLVSPDFELLTGLLVHVG